MTTRSDAEDATADSQNVCIQEDHAEKLAGLFSYCITLSICCTVHSAVQDYRTVKLIRPVNPINYSNYLELLYGYGLEELVQ